MAVAPTNGLQRLRERGAPAQLLDAIAVSGLPGDVALGAVEACGLINRLRLMISPRAPLSTREQARLQAVAALAQEVAESEGGPENAYRFWDYPMPWLGGRTPANWLERGDIGAIEDLRTRINYGIPP